MGCRSKDVVEYYPGTFIGRGISENELIFGGRYLLIKFKGVYEGMEFEGIGYNGYDNFKKKYFNIWLDNMGTGYYLTEGTCEKSICNYYGMGIDPEHSKEFKTHEVVKYVDDNKWIHIMYQIEEDGKEFKAMEITYTRQVFDSKLKR